MKRLERNLLTAFVICIFIIGMYGGYQTRIFNEEDKNIEYIRDTVVQYINGCNLYEEAILHLKDVEGFRSSVYTDDMSNKLIGYGHMLYKTSTVDSLSEKKAEMLLRDDLDAKIDYINVNYDVNENQALALGMIAFNIGEGKLARYIKEDSLLEGDNINKILNYCHYKSILNGDTILKRSEALYKRRKFELYIYQHPIN